jgi:hypothetical protein
MIEKFEHNNEVYALIIKRDFSCEGINFITPNSYNQQIGYMKREMGYQIQPHIHINTKRTIYGTSEVLFIKRGRVKVNFFDLQKNYLSSRILETGDFILLMNGGHGFEILEEAEIIEIKQGPYVEDNDKLKF